MGRQAVLAVAASALLALAAAQGDGGCPFIDGERVCVPVLGACESCNPARGPGDGICAETLLCDPEDAVCRGADVNEKCGNDSGKECDEGLYCLRLAASWQSGRQEERCYIAGGEGDVCERDEGPTGASSSLPDSAFENPRFRRGCGQGLLCFDNGDGRGAVCNPDDGREEPCELNSCSRVGEECVGGSSGRRRCTKVVPIGAACEPGVSTCESGFSASCVDVGDGGGFKCVAVSDLGRACGGSTVCRKRDGLNLRCEAGYCAEDEGPGGLLQLCGSDTDCSVSASRPAQGMSCAVAQDGNQRCLNLFQQGELSYDDCARSKEYARTQGLPTVTCPTGYECKLRPDLVQRGLGVGSCERVAPAQVGEACSAIVKCVADDGEGRLVICSSGPGPPRCLRRLRDGETCSIENGVCDSGAEFGLGDRLRAASCDQSNVCRVSSDETCTDDSECDSSAGKTCVSVYNLGSPGSKTCYNYNRQVGESCKSDSVFGTPWDEACADGLTCLENSPGRNSIAGTCVKLADDGERCNPDEGVVCIGTTVGAYRSVCNNGTCRPLAKPR